MQLETAGGLLLPENAVEDPGVAVCICTLRINLDSAVHEAMQAESKISINMWRFYLESFNCWSR
jgi:hypothetical protein